MMLPTGFSLLGLSYVSTKSASSGASSYEGVIRAWPSPCGTVLSQQTSRLHSASRSVQHGSRKIERDAHLCAEAPSCGDAHLGAAAQVVETIVVKRSVLRSQARLMAGFDQAPSALGCDVPSLSTPGAKGDPQTHPYDSIDDWHDATPLVRQRRSPPLAKPQTAISPLAAGDSLRRRWPPWARHRASILRKTTS